jgi:hypothetical protein
LYGGLLAMALASALLVEATATASRRFYDDDPLWVEADTEDARGVESRPTSYAFDIVDNLFLEPGDEAVNVRAANLNTVDEVPDSSWFTNRIGRQPMDVDRLLRANSTGGPAAGIWTIISAKGTGRAPGFVIEDRTGQRWFLKFDVPGHNGMATGSEVLVNRIMWALGYNVPEYEIAYVDVERLALSSDARIEPRGFHERAMKRLDIQKLLAQADREADGTFRASASRQLPGTPLGPFRFYGTRPDDPNDVVAHEHRRELRALRVFSAWVNHVEMRAGNTLDTLVVEGGRSLVRHHLLDFGATLGSASVKIRPWWEGHAYMYEGDAVWKSAATLGFWKPGWQRLDFFEADAIGRMPALGEVFDPDAWKPGIPNAAFLRARADDDFWAARRVTAFSDEMIRALARTARFTDPGAERFIAEALIHRRHAIARTYLPRVNPIVEPTLSADGTLGFRNAAVDAGVAREPDRYAMAWAEFDNATGGLREIGQTEGASGGAAPVALPAREGSIVRVAISSRVLAHPAWAQPVHAFFRRNGDGTWKLVGLDRVS